MQRVEWLLGKGEKQIVMTAAMEAHARRRRLRDRRIDFVIFRQCANSNFQGLLRENTKAQAFGLTHTFWVNSFADNLRVDSVEVYFGHSHVGGEKKRNYTVWREKKLLRNF